MIKRAIGTAYFFTMRSLSRLGELVGSEALIYNPLVHAAFERSARRNAPPLIEAIRRHVPHARSLFDVGCGTGTFAAEAKSSGLTVAACEYSARLRKRVEAKGVKVFPFDVSKPKSYASIPELPYDVALTTEVAEHVPESLADAFVEFVHAAGRTIVFTAAQPGQGGTGHINLQPREYWIRKFEAIGARYDDALTTAIRSDIEKSRAEAFMSRNLSVFHRA
jgi:SAM-dependent methyltransferase